MLTELCLRGRIIKNILLSSLDSYVLNNLSFYFYSSENYKAIFTFLKRKVGLKEH